MVIHVIGINKEVYKVLYFSIILSATCPPSQGAFLKLKLVPSHNSAVFSAEKILGVVLQTFASDEAHPDITAIIWNFPAKNSQILRLFDKIKSGEELQIIEMLVAISGLVLKFSQNFQF